MNFDTRKLLSKCKHCHVEVKFTAKVSKKYKFGIMALGYVVWRSNNIIGRWNALIPPL